MNETHARDGVALQGKKWVLSIAISLLLWLTACALLLSLFGLYDPSVMAW